MLYDNYKRKVLGIGQILSRIIKLLPIIIAAVSVAVAATAALVYFKGTVGELTVPSQTVAYGEGFAPDAGVFLGEVSYEYAAEGSDVWSSEYPLYAGKYLVRAVGKTSFGGNRYSAAVAFEILPHSIDVYVPEGSQYMYGTLPAATAELLEGEVMECTSFTYSDKLSPSTQVTPVKESIKVFNAEGKDITFCYSFNVLSTNVNITKRPIDITVESTDKVYDGLALTFDKYDCDMASLAEGDTLIATFSASIAEAGTVANTPTLKVLDADGDDVSLHYAMNVTEGMLTVDKRPVAFLSKNPESTEYNGEPAVFDAFELKADTPVLEGHTAKNLTSDDSYPANAGVHTNPTAIGIFDAQGKDVSHNYSVFIEEAPIKITKKHASVTTGSATWVYDAQGHTVERLEEVNGLLAADTAEVAGNPTEAKDAGTYDNVLGVRIYNASRADVTDNYEIEFTYGVLTVEKKVLHVKPQNVTAVYDGQRHYISEVIYTGTERPCEGHIIGVVEESSLSRIDAGATTETLPDGALTVVDNGGTSYTHNYEIICDEAATVTIEKRPILITAGDDRTKEYDGLPFVYDVASDSVPEGVDVGGLAVGHRIEINAFDSELPDCGKYVWKLDEEVHIYDDAVYEDYEVTANYEIEVDDAPVTMEITPIMITVMPKPYEAVYSGQLQVLDELVIHDPDGKYGALGARYIGDGVIYSGTNVSDSNATVTVAPKDVELYYVASGETAWIANYAVATAPSSFTIKPRPLQITSASASDTKVYDGNCFYADGVAQLGETDSESGLVEGHSVSLGKSGYIRTEFADVQIYTIGLFGANIEDIVSIEGTDMSNYAIEFVPTEQVGITQRRLVVNPTADAFKYYDGDPIYATGIEASEGLLTNLGHTVILSVDGKRFIYSEGVDVGHYALTLADGANIEHYVIMGGGASVYNYDVVFESGSATFEIKPKPITVTPYIYGKIYDGTPLSVSVDATYDREGGAELLYRVEGFAFEKYDYSNAGDYRVSVFLEESKLYASLYYNGELMETVRLTVVDANGNAVTDNMEISCGADAEATISQRQIYVRPTVDSIYKTYNATYFYAEGIEADDRLLTSLGHTIELTEAGRKVIHSSGVDAGEYFLSFYGEDIELYVTMGGGASVDNYELIFRDDVGVRIMPRRVVVNPAAQNKVFDGYAIYATGVTEYITGEADEGLLTDLGHSLTLTEEGKRELSSPSAYVGRHEIYLSGIWDIESILSFEGGALAKNYEVEYQSGGIKFEITKRHVLLTPNITGKVYDGNPLEYSITASKPSDVDVGGLVEGHVLSYPFYEYSEAEDYTLHIKLNSYYLPWATITLGTERSMDFDISITVGDFDITENYDFYYEASANATIEKCSVTLTPHLTYSDPDNIYNGDKIVYWVSGDLGSSYENRWWLGGNEFTVMAEFGSYSDVDMYRWDIAGNNKPFIMLGNEDVTKNFKITCAPAATITIYQREITLTPMLFHSGGNIYDGTSIYGRLAYRFGDNIASPVTSDEIGLSGNIFLLNYTSPSDKNAGTHTWDISLQENRPTITLRGENVTKNFKISYADNPATITIAKCDITLTPRLNHANFDGEKFVYNGTSIYGTMLYSLGNISADDNEFYLAGGKFTLGYEQPQGKDVGKYAWRLEKQDVSIYLGDENASENFNITFNYAESELEICKRRLAVTPSTDTPKAYDNKPYYALDLEQYGETDKFSGLIEGHSVTLRSGCGQYIRSHGVNVGWYYLYLYDKTVDEITELVGDGASLDNYYLEYVDSTEMAQIVPREVYIVPTVQGKLIYNGDIFYNSGIVQGANGATQGLLTVGAHGVEYDHVIGYYPSELFRTDSELAGSRSMILMGDLNKVTILCGGEDVTDNYVVKYKEHTHITIDRRPIIVAPYVDSQRELWKVYDGDYYYGDGVRVSVDSSYGLLTGHSLSVASGGVHSAEVSAGFHKLVGDTKSISVMYGSTDMTANYEFIYGRESVTVEIRPIKLTVAPADEEKTYDGTPLYASSIVILGENEKGYTATATMTPQHWAYLGEITDFGVAYTSFDNLDDWDIIVKIFDSDGNDISDNCELIPAQGTLRINKRDVVLKPMDKNGDKYDGHKHSVSGLMAQESFGMVEGHMISAEGMRFIYTCPVCGLPAEDGFEGHLDEMCFTAEVTIDPSYGTVVVLDANGNDVTENYNISLSGTGSITLAPPSIRVELKDISTEYSDSILNIPTGMPLVSEVTDEVGFAFEIEVSVISIDLRSVNAGTYFYSDDILKDRIVYAVVRKDTGEDVTDIVDVGFEGILEIAKRVIRVSTDSATLKYDPDEALICESAEIENVIAGHTVILKYSGVNQGDPDIETQVPNEAEIILILDAQGNEVQDNYDEEYSFGVLTVTPLD